MLNWIILLPLCLHIITAQHCADMVQCQCIPHYISCRNTVSLPDVLASAVTPLAEAPLVMADLRSNALSQEVLTRFVLVFSGSLERVLLTEQLEPVCSYIDSVKSTFPKINFETDCEVSYMHLFFIPVIIIQN